MALGALGSYLFRQAFRARIGSLWPQTIRPFLIAGSLAAAATAVLPFIPGIQFNPPSEARIAAVFAACLAVGLFLPVAILRTPDRPGSGRAG